MNRRRRIKAAAKDRSACPSDYLKFCGLERWPCSSSFFPHPGEGEAPGQVRGVGTGGGLLGQVGDPGTGGEGLGQVGGPGQVWVLGQVRGCWDRWPLTTLCPLSSSLSPL